MFHGKNQTNRSYVYVAIYQSIISNTCPPSPFNFRFGSVTYSLMESSTEITNSPSKAPSRQPSVSPSQSPTSSPSKEVIFYCCSFVLLYDSSLSLDLRIPNFKSFISHPSLHVSSLNTYSPRKVQRLVNHLHRQHSLR